MRNGRNPTRRNRNIGTSKQGYGQDNKLRIPQPWDTCLTYYERLSNYEKFTLKVHGKELLFVVEQLNSQFYYSCTAGDAQKVLNAIPKNDLQDLGLIVFRQPKKKERILSPVWGRLIYSMEFEEKFYPAIIIEAFPKINEFKFPKKQSVDSKLEFELLKNDGLVFEEQKRNFVAKIDMDIVRNIQLYRTLLHEVGHYVHYYEVVESINCDTDEYEEWSARWEKYLAIPSPEKEKYANNYAVRMKGNLLNSSLIPFDRID